MSDIPLSVVRGPLSVAEELRTPDQARVYSFADALRDGVDARVLLGGKGASLNQMYRAGLHVPPGFTINADCCRQYFEAGRRWPDGLEHEVRSHLARLEQQMNRTFGRGPRPLLVSVRSGAAVSMPGMMDTLLNCGLNPSLAEELNDPIDFQRIYGQFIVSFARTAAHVALDAPAADVDRLLDQYRRLSGEEFPVDPWDMLRRCINAVFESWLNPRAAAYRSRHGLDALGGTGVTVQAMFPSEVSGVLFTQDPTDFAAERIIVESAYGLGESIVSGDLTPDRFRVSRHDFGDFDTHIGHKASAVWALGASCELNPDAVSLSRDQLAELCTLGLQVEKYFDHPVDIEWGLCEGRFALLQARPIRGLDAARAVESVRQEEIARLRQLAGKSPRIWVTHNLGETLRAPTPLTWDLTRQFMTGNGGFGRLYRELGYRPSKAICDDGFLELICGRIYADPDRLVNLFWDGLPLAYDVESLLRDPSLINQAPTRFDANRTDSKFLVQLPGNLISMWRVSRNVRRLRRSVLERFERRIRPVFQVFVEEARTQDLTELSDDQLLGEFGSRRKRVLDDFSTESLLPGFLGGLAWDALRSRLIQLMGNQEGDMLANRLVGGLDGDTTIEQNTLLFRVAQGQASVNTFMERFGHRCIGEMELSVPRWREEPSYVQQMITLLKTAADHDPERMHAEKHRQRLEAEAELPDRLRHWGGSSFREEIERDLRDAQRLLPYREAGKHYLMMGYETLRHVTEELARRWQLGQEVYFLQRSELAGFNADRTRLTELARERRVRWQAMQRLDVPDVIDSRNLDRLGLPSPLVGEGPGVRGADALPGTCISSGVAEGIARVVLTPADAVDLGQDYVLVCPSTDPGWTPLFIGARGLVMEKGGVLSHGAIVARDFGIPAIVCPNATRLLSSGDRVRVDANQGRVLIVKPLTPNPSPPRGEGKGSANPSPRGGEGKG